jgi:HxlR-like helix-turn-helix
MDTCVLYCISLREVRRFNELQRQIPDISKKMLIQTLRNLERDGLVERTVYQQVPPKTEYRLTEDGAVEAPTIGRQSARVRLATSAAAIPVPPVRPARIGTASPPARNENEHSIGPIVPPAPETAPQSISPYGALVRVTPIE